LSYEGQVRLRSSSYEGQVHQSADGNPKYAERSQCKKEQSSKVTKAQSVFELCGCVPGFCGTNPNSYLAAQWRRNWMKIWAIFVKKRKYLQKFF